MVHTKAGQKVSHHNPTSGSIPLPPSSLSNNRVLLSGFVVSSCKNGQRVYPQRYSHEAPKQRESLREVQMPSFSAHLPTCCLKWADDLIVHHDVVMMFHCGQCARLEELAQT